MYTAKYVFYKIDYDHLGQETVHSVKLQEFNKPQEEITVTRDRRREGFKTLRVSNDIYRILSATQAAENK